MMEGEVQGVLWGMWGGCGGCGGEGGMWGDTEC